MRPDQLQRLQDLSESLADSFLSDADPSMWPASGKLAADMTREERGDAYWCRKMAMSTGGVLRYTLDLIQKVTVPTGGTPEEPGEQADLDARIRDAEKRAEAAMARVLNKAKGKDAFDKRVHGKAR